MERKRRVYKYDDWKRYLKYLENWIKTHRGLPCAGMSPACYDEWEDNEKAMEEDDDFE